MNNSNPKNNAIQHPLSGSSFVNLVKLFLSNQITEPRYIKKALQIILLSLSNLPLSIIERLVFGTQIDQTEIVEAPIFIIGHWRSGTTYLHRLMIQDYNFGYVSSLQTFLPQNFLLAGRLGKEKLDKIWPKTRDMDKVSYSPDVPEEEEYALGNILPLSFYHCWFFPKNMKQLFFNSVLMEKTTDSSLKQWKKTYIQIIKKATFACKNKRLVIKNPANTARIKLLLDMFPQAKFIYISRNPYDVFASTKNFFEKLMPKYALQKFNKELIEENVFTFYKQLVEKFTAEKKIIPQKNLIEIKYEDLEGNELLYLKYIYNKFNLPGFDLAQVNMQKYVDSLSNYQKNNYKLDEQKRQEISHRWSFAIKEWQNISKLEIEAEMK